MNGMLKKAIEIMSYNEESDFECYRVGYSFSYTDGKIRFNRTQTSPTGEYDGFGVIDTKSHTSTLFEVECGVEQYANLIISYINYREDDKYAEYIDFMKILKR